MPIYEYECKKCSSRFELLGRVGEDNNACCPRCGGHGERVFSAVPMIFKGGRWVGEKVKTTDGDGSKKTATKNKAD